MTPGVLLTHGDDAERLALQTAIRDRGHGVEAVGTVDDALAQLRAARFDTVVVGTPRDREALDAVQRILRTHPGLDVIVASPHARLDGIVEAFELRVTDYVPGPLDPQEVARAVHRLWEQRAIARLLELPIPEPSAPFDEIRGDSEPVCELRAQLRRIADSDANALVTGETGTGKEIVARAMHRHGPRSRGAFVALNCAAIPAELLESELFGHSRGAFTGAARARKGLLAHADGGTVFLDEVASLPHGLQAKLLRVLQERKLRPVGSDTEVEFDARIIAASNESLEQAVRGQRFREDLYYRLHVLHLELPPLRERGFDVLLLARLFVAEGANRVGTPVKGLTPAAARCLLAYSWPGNVREIENCCEAAVTNARYDHIREEDLPARVRGARPSSEPADDGGDLVPLEAIECAHLAHVMREVDGNKAEASRILGVDRKTIYRKLKQHGLEDFEPRTERDDEDTARFETER